MIAKILLGIDFALTDKNVIRENMYKLLLVLGLGSVAFANYTNCKMKNENYEDVCQRVVKLGVSYSYANEFLLSCEKTKDLDEKSWKYLDPDKITHLRKNEKRANNTLLPHVPKILRHLKKYSHVYDFTEKKFGVNREIVASILMKETALGSIKLKHDAFKVCNTIVMKSKAKTPRQKWLLEMGKSNMTAVIKHCYELGVKPSQCNLPSSYAGAIGIPQFMPESFIYAQGYKNKIPDLNKMEDAIVSASKFLHEKADFDTLIDWEKLRNIAEIESDWYDFELKHQDASLVYKINKRDASPYRCYLCQKKEFSYLLEYAKKIMVYNNSSNYAIGVMRLGYESYLGLHKGKK